MYPKNKTLVLIKHYLPIFKKGLKIKSTRIKVRVYSPKSKEFLSDKYYQENARYDNEYGCTVLAQGKNPNVIYIFYTKHASAMQTVGTLFHELAHIKYDELQKHGRAANLEENFIRAVERVIRGLLFKG